MAMTMRYASGVRLFLVWIILLVVWIGSNQNLWLVSGTCSYDTVTTSVEGLPKLMDECGPRVCEALNSRLRRELASASPPGRTGGCELAVEYEKGGRYTLNFSGRGAETFTEIRVLFGQLLAHELLLRTEDAGLEIPKPFFNGGQTAADGLGTLRWVLVVTAAVALFLLVKSSRISDRKERPANVAPATDAALPGATTSPPSGTAFDRG